LLEFELELQQRLRAIRQGRFAHADTVGLGPTSSVVRPPLPVHRKRGKPTFSSIGGQEILPK
jgi:hypothetical protein